MSGHPPAVSTPAIDALLKAGFEFQERVLMSKVGGIKSVKRTDVGDLMNRIVTAVADSPEEMDALRKLGQSALNCDTGNDCNRAGPFMYAADGISPVEEQIIECFERTEDSLRVIQNAERAFRDREQLRRSTRAQTRAGFQTAMPFALGSRRPTSGYGCDEIGASLFAPVTFSSSALEPSECAEGVSPRTAARSNLSRHRESLTGTIEELEGHLEEERSHLTEVHSHRAHREREMVAEESEIMERVAALSAEKSTVERRLATLNEELKAARTKEIGLLERHRRFVEAQNTLSDEIRARIENTQANITEATREQELVLSLSNMMSSVTSILEDIVSTGKIQIDHQHRRILSSSIEKIRTLVASESEHVLLLKEQRAQITSLLSRDEEERGSRDALCAKYVDIEAKLQKKQEEMTKLRGVAESLLNRNREEDFLSDGAACDNCGVRELLDAFATSDGGHVGAAPHKRPTAVAEYIERRSGAVIDVEPSAPEITTIEDTFFVAM